MSDYRPPLEDIDFVLNHVVDLGRIARYEAFAHADPDTVRGVLDEAGRFAAEVLAPLNRVGDQQGSTMRAGRVGPHARRLGEGVQAVRRRGVGRGVRRPRVRRRRVPVDGRRRDPGARCPRPTRRSRSRRCSPRAPSTCSGTTPTSGGRSSCCRTSSPAQWSGTMNLTEPQAGQRRRGAAPRRRCRSRRRHLPDHRQKIFITYGEHDLTENIVHLVLARTPGAPPGTKGISCFIVPKFLVERRRHARRAQRRAMRVDRAQAGHPRQPHLRHVLRRRRRARSATSSARRTRACATCSR